MVEKGFTRKPIKTGIHISTLKKGWRRILQE